MSGIAYRGRVFWCRDGLLELWLALLCEEIDAQAATHLRALRALLYDGASVQFNGLRQVDLDPQTTDDDARRELVDLCRTARARLRTAPPRGALAHRLARGRWGDPAMAAGLERVADSLVWLLEEPRVAP
jgi:hypothetical protein